MVEGVVVDPSARAFEKSVRSAERGRRGGQAGAGALGQAGASGPQNLSLFPLFASFRLFPSPLSLSLSLSTFLAPYSLFPSQISAFKSRIKNVRLCIVCVNYTQLLPHFNGHKKGSEHTTHHKRESQVHTLHTNTK